MVGNFGDCARAAIGHDTAPPTSVMNSRRRMGFPQSQWPEFRLLIDPNDFFVPQVYTPGDPRWKDADSSIFLNLALEEIQNAGYRILNVDTTLVLSAPKIGPISADLRERVADLLNVSPSDVGIKAKTPEGLNADHVAQAHAVVLLQKIDSTDDLRAMEASIASEERIEAVVEELVSQVHEIEPRPTIKPAFDTDDIT